MQIQGACTLMMSMATGRLSELKGMEVQHIELFSEYEDVSSFKLRELSFHDGERESLTFTYPECQTEKGAAMANKVKEKSPEERLVEEIQKLGRTNGMNTVFTNSSGTDSACPGNSDGSGEPSRAAGKLRKTGEIYGQGTQRL